MNCIKLMFFIISACCIYHSSLNAQIKLTQYVVGNGAATISGSSNVSSVTIGQPIIGNTSNTLHSNNIGFWYQYTEIISDVEEKLSNEIPIEFQLYQNYPNPFNPSTTIRYGLPKESKVSLEVYNILGERVTQLVNQQLKAGYHEVEFNNSSHSSGIYFYRIQAGDFVETKKMILLK